MQSWFDTLHNGKPAPVVLNFKPNLHDIVHAEVRQMGLQPEILSATAIRTQASLDDAIRLCFSLRTVNYVRYALASFQSVRVEPLYRTLLKLPWESLLTSASYFSVSSWSHTTVINNLMFLNQKVKDAIADRFRKIGLRRPSSGPGKQGVVFYVHWKGNQVQVYLDLSGTSLHRRGYRQHGGQAPLEETLAAAMVLASGWQPDQPLVVPMCGSGTLAIEAALLATRTAPGLLREHYSFRHIRCFDEASFSRIVDELRAQRLPAQPVIVAADHDTAILDQAKANAQRAGIASLISFHHESLENTPLPACHNGVILLNPPYGIRMGEKSGMPALYRQIGAFVRKRARGYRVLLLTGSPDLMRFTGLQPTAQRILYNGAIACTLFTIDQRQDVAAMARTARA